MTPSIYRDLLGVALRHTRRRSEAEDLVQDALLEAVRSGRCNPADPATVRWLAGIIRNKARFTARGAIRSRRREQSWMLLQPSQDEAADPSDAPSLVSQLPPALRAVLVLALTGHTRREIAYLLGLPDTALRQRVRALRRRLQAGGLGLPAGLPGLNLDLAYGRIRETLLPLLLRQGGTFATHDPDGHALVVRRRP